MSQQPGHGEDEDAASASHPLTIRTCETTQPEGEGRLAERERFRTRRDPVDRRTGLCRGRRRLRTCAGDSDPVTDSDRRVRHLHRMVGRGTSLHVTHSANFDTNAPLIKISWADAGSGVLTFTFVVVALALGLWIDRQQPASRVIAIAAMAGILASLVDLFVL